MNVVELDRGNLNDIPEMLERVAKSIRDGEYGVITSAAATFMDEHGDVIVFGWGQTNDVHSIGLLQIGANWLSWQRSCRK